jgi:soluble lytic murein transglycosylase-like protein
MSRMKLSTFPLLFGLCLYGTPVHSTEVPNLHEIIRVAAVSHGISPPIALALVETESTFDPSSYSEGNYGLMQVRYNTAKDMGFNGTKEQLMDVSNNIEYGMRFLEYCYKRFHSDRAALECYNGSDNKEAYASLVIKRSAKYK